MEVGGRGVDYTDRPRPTYRYTVTTRKDYCGIKIGSDESQSVITCEGQSHN